MLYALDGDTISIPPNCISTVDDKFADNLNPAEVRLVSMGSTSTETVEPEPSGFNGDNFSYKVNTPPHSVLVTDYLGNVFAAITLAEGEVLGRLPGQSISGLNASELLSIGIGGGSGGGDGTYSPMDEHLGTATNGSMILAELPYIPLSDSVEVFVNGIALTLTDYFIGGNGRNIMGTVGLNESYGGSGADGLGFSNDDEVRVVYKRWYMATDTD